MILLGLIVLVCTWGMFAWNRLAIWGVENEIQKLKYDYSEIWKAIAVLQDDNEKMWKDNKALKEENKKIWLEINTLFEMAEGVR